jgi:hypothetical protein
MNPCGKVQLIFANVIGNLLDPFISKNLDDISTWNKKVDECIAEVFDFAQILLGFDGAVLLFHPDDLIILKEVKSYLESYGFQIRMNWAVVNSLPLMNNKEPIFQGSISIH